MKKIESKKWTNARNKINSPYSSYQNLEKLRATFLANKANDVEAASKLTLEFEPFFNFSGI